MCAYLRKKKKSDVVESFSEIWNNRLSKLVADKFGSRKLFIDAYKERYGVGNTATTSRWFNVGNKSSKNKIIGFPTYDTMRRIADILDVTVGYLTGETDYFSFEMERACEYLGIDQHAGNSILRITKMKKATRFEKYEKINYGKALCLFLSAEQLEEFIGGICQCAEAAYQQAHPTDHMKSTRILSIDPEILDLAIQYKDTFYEEATEESIQLTDEVIDAIHAIRDAEMKGYSQQFSLEQNMKLAKYDLQERYFSLIEELLLPQNCEKIQSHYYENVSSVAELKQRIMLSVTE